MSDVPWRQPRVSPVETEFERWLEWMRLDMVLPAPRNPKMHSSDIGASIDRFGYLEPIVIDERTGRLISGHGRVEALGELWAADMPVPEGVAVDEDGMWMVPTIRGWSSRSDSEAEAALLAVNQLMVAGGWDQDQLDGILADLAEEQVSLEGLGFPDEVLAEAWGDLPRSLDLVVACPNEKIRDKVTRYALKLGAEVSYLDDDVAEEEPVV